MLSLILPVCSLHYQLHKNVIQKQVAVLDRTRHHIHGHVSLHLRARRRHLREKTMKRALQYLWWLTMLKPVGPIFTHAHNYSPCWRLRRKSHSDVVEITQRKLTYIVSIRLRSVVTAPNRQTTHLLWRHNNTTDVTFKYSDVYANWGPPFFVFFFFFVFVSMSARAFAYFARSTRIRLPLHCGTAACATFGYISCFIALYD